MIGSPRVRLGQCRDLICPAMPAWFSPVECERWHGLGAARKGPFLGSRMLMRGLLRDELGGSLEQWRLDARGHPLGYPRRYSRHDPLTPGPGTLQTSISHHQERAAAALCNDAQGLGIDLERRHRSCRWEAIARRWFAPAEQALLAQCQSPQGERLFYRLWTLKEAWVKATRRGLAGHFQAIQLIPDGDGGWHLEADTDVADWQAWSGWAGSDCLAIIWQGTGVSAPRIETARLGGRETCTDIESLALEDPLRWSVKAAGPAGSGLVITEGSQ